VTFRLPPADLPHIDIVEIRPNVAGGRYPLKRVAGESMQVVAVIQKGGYDALAAELRYRKPGSTAWEAAPMRYVYDSDEWFADLELDSLGRWEYAVAAWTDTFGSWCSEIERKHAAGLDLASELLEGTHLLQAFAESAATSVRADILETAAAIAEAMNQEAAVAAALSPGLRSLVNAADHRPDLVLSASLEVWVDRVRARFGAWYEMFPRSQSTRPGRHGTFADVEAQLPRIRDLGFDVIYFPPIHPIGHSNRKGPNNSLVAGPDDVGSPWAIGSEAGGHDAIEPALGSLADFDRLVAAANREGLEVALDFAIQCSPDHPYVRQHPEWFRQRPDGSIKYAENPPKKYEDIVALDLWCADYAALWAELRRVVLHWVEHGVRIFRVDNPHTKPIAFWKWLIRSVREEHPDVFFLAEAFTRPALLHELAKIGFSQSYTYFTWRNTREEIEQYATEVAHGPGVDYLRPNFFANTPDILHEYLQRGGRPAFKVRFALAATLSPACGIYSGFELCENEALHEGSEEYLDSEKYQLRLRDWDAPGNINAFVAAVNRARRENPALQHLRNLSFHNPENPQVLACSKATPMLDNRILLIANLDPFGVQESIVHLDGGALGIDESSRYVLHDLVTGERFTWYGTANYVRLDPSNEPVHLFRVEEP